VSSECCNRLPKTPQTRCNLLILHALHSCASILPKTLDFGGGVAGGTVMTKNEIIKIR
jgi:hypothetical protein